AALIATTARWEVPFGSAVVFVALMWASSLSVINLHSMLVVMAYPVIMVCALKYDPGATALISAIGSLSVQEIRILRENNDEWHFALKLLGNRGVSALCAYAASAAFHFFWPHPYMAFGDLGFLGAAASSGVAWMAAASLIMNIGIILSRPQLKLTIDPTVALTAVTAIAPSVIMGLMATALFEHGGLIPFVLAEWFFIANKNFTQRALIKKENAEQINIAFARIIDSKDHYTGGHSERVARLARTLAEAARLPKAEVEEIEYVARLHDVGKVNLPDSVLTKNNLLSPDEYEMVKKHPAWGADLIRGMQRIYGDKHYRAILEHHERYDGLGYPDGKKGVEISLWGRILAICDAYDAMTTDRPYKPALAADEARRELENCAGSQFDPELVQLFVSKVLA
ncbi:MAG: HD-GYP domain-containing protein, partial [Firmicutes bacterium]|nr:HD-GYP domain-containing protein [Bacillota bacterium]